jgi:hypothetical protein
LIVFLARTDESECNDQREDLDLVSSTAGHSTSPAVALEVIAPPLGLWRVVVPTDRSRPQIDPDPGNDLPGEQ